MPWRQLSRGRITLLREMARMRLLTVSEKLLKKLLRKPLLPNSEMPLPRKSPLRQPLLPVSEMPLLRKPLR